MWASVILTIVTRYGFPALFLAVCSILAQSGATSSQQPPQEPPEEDISTDRPKEYVFNPLQAANEVRVGNYYYKKGSFRAAAGRFQEAIKWDPNNADAWLRLGDAQAKMKHEKEARAAWAKYLELKPDAKDAVEIKKKLGSRS